MKQKIKLMLGDNIESLKKIPDNSIDSVVTDPPYGLGKERDMNIILKDWIEKGYSEIEGTGFMNKEWDAYVPQPQFWKEVYRVLKPGGHILAFFGTRTYDIGTMAIRMAGFEIRDQIMWLYGSGFPKSHNIGKAVDKFGGNNLLSTEIGLKLKESRTLRGLTLKQADELFCGGTSNYNWLEGRSDGQRIPNQELFDKIVMEWPELKDLRDKVISTQRELLGIEITNKSVMKKIGDKNDSGEYERTKGNSPYEGWGTALKPANEPICLARKPLSEKSVAENVLKWGTGGINIDGCRVEGVYGSGQNEVIEGKSVGIKNKIQVSNAEGRFPANLILECICDEVIKGEKGELKSSSRRFEILQNKSEGKVERIENYGDKGDIHTNPMCPCRLLDEQSGVSKSSPNKWEGEVNIFNDGENKTTGHKKGIRIDTYSDSGGSSRFFYQAKVSKAERNMGLDGFEDKESVLPGLNTFDEEGNRLRNDGSVIPPLVSKNNHPTVKPINLMTYLCRLITPEGGIILDPFMGSGSTGISAQLEGFRFVGMEMDPEYFKIAEARIENYEKYKKFHNKNADLKNGNTRMASRSDNSNSIGLGICKKKKN